jgi:hypothetical protein
MILEVLYMKLVLKYSMKAVFVVLGCMTIVFNVYILSYKKRSIIIKLQTSLDNE